MPRRFSAAECSDNITQACKRPPASEHFMPFFSKRVSMLEVQNRALIKTAGERAERIDKLEHELQQVNREMERLIVGVERLKAEREFYSKRVVALEEQNRQLTQSATKYSLWGQKLERELATRSTRRRRCLRPSARRSENTYSPCRMARSDCPVFFS